VATTGKFEVAPGAVNRWAYMRGCHT
jgi:hypothetical protein